MGTEIERKFLVNNDLWKAGSGQGVEIRQGYIAFGPPTAVRVRIAGEKANINIKKATLAISRDEFEYPVPMDDAYFLIENLCERHIIEKRRFRVEHEGHLWEIDVFSGLNTGLIVAEIELEREDEAFARPAWLGEEVSGDPRYLNSQLATKPFTEW